ncbi:alanine--tRNA ligase [Candidatus Pacearchaeota archaeon]|nr:alanine--tRNA ligase [Candidatus Pacearchaeota archaeon]
MTRQELIKKYLEFFKKQGHKEIPSSSLVPANDPTVLFTTAGMHPLVPFLLGQPHPLGKRLVDIQKCIRTGDIDEVGDSFHHTFFEMMGNWSLGDYFKKEAIAWSYEFATKILGLKKEKLAVTIFAGNSNSPKDTESEKLWLELGIPKEKISFLESNWWEHPSNNTPCGPCTEMFYWKPNNLKVPKKFNPEDNNWVEIWNDVLMGFTKIGSKYIPAKQKNIDNGRGLERVLAVLNGFEDNYLTDVWHPIIKEIENLSGKKYNGNEKTMRIIADHIKASVMIIADGITPSNTERGYVLRRLIRRAIRYASLLGIKENFTHKLIEPIIEIYSDYKELKKNKNNIIAELDKEENKFRATLEQGLREFDKIKKDKKELSGKEAFLLYQSYGFPIEMTEELAKENKIKLNQKEFYEENKKHQELSRTSSSGQFKSGLADNSEATTRLHTAAHLLNQALREILEDKTIAQKGSNINPERLRFDFNFPRKLTEEELRKVEDWINNKIKQKISVVREEMPLKKALESGAHGEFGAKYPEIVSVYSISNISREICTGPHVKNTSELGKFKITKEESSSAGVRRIKAVLN